MKAITLFLLVFLPLAAFADDGGTYNFYFQKAPGPVTVNQGGAPAQPTVVTPSGAVVVAQPAAAPAATGGNVVAAIDAPAIGPRPWHLSFGYTMFVTPQTESNLSLAMNEDKTFRDGQLALNLERDLFNNFAVGGSLYRTHSPIQLSDGIVVGANGTNEAVLTKVDPTAPAKFATDYSLYGAFHLLRTYGDGVMLSVLGGYQTVPYIQYKLLNVYDARFQNITGGNTNASVALPVDGVQHEGTIFGGVRLRLLAADTWGVEASYRYYPGLRHDLATVSLAAAF